jgi:penicillin-binding protein 2
MMIQKKDLLDPDEIFADSANVTNLSYGSEGKLEKPIAGLYYILFLLLMGAGLAYLVSRSIVLQIKEGDNFLAKSQENRFLTRPIFPPRGVIYDRSGNVLVENHPSFGLLLDMREFFSGGGKIEDLVKILNDGLGYESGAFSNNSRDFPRQVVLAQGIAPSAMVSLAPRLFQVDGVHFFESFRRIYKDNFAYSHVLGFVGSMSEEELARSSDLKSGDSIGKSGLEAYYDEILRGEAGKKIVEIDAHGEEMRFRTVDEPKRGSDISLTLDGDLQGFIYKTIENYTAGVKGASVVALDPRGGEVRALVSFPGFNSNKFGHSLSSKEFEAVLGNRLKPLFNRAISGEFPSGSTIKPLIGAAALEEKIIDPQKLIYDEGYIEIPNPYLPGERSVFVDWKKHGWINFYDAIAQSANVYFYIVGGGYKDQKELD